MKRAILATVCLSGLVVAPIASAHHAAGGKAKGAVLASINPGVPIVARDWRVIISANSWATSQNQTSDLGEWVYVSHLRHGRWQYVGGFGEGIGLGCRKLRIPKAIAQDLKVYCA